MAASKGHLSVSYRDEKRALTSLAFFFNSSTGLLADMLAGAATMLPILDAATDSVIVKSDLVIPVALPGGLKTTPTAGADNEDAALIDFTVAGSPNAFSLAYPAWISAGFLAAYPKFVDFTQAAVAALVAEMIGGSTGFVPSDRYYNDITASISGINAFRKHRRAIARAK